MRVSVVIPLFNGAQYIEHALQSVLRQTTKPYEIIVVNDGSTDDGASIVERLAAVYPITLFNRPNGGQSAARNYGIAKSGGELIALLDQDDEWYSTHLETLVEPFTIPRAVPLGWVYSNLDEMDREGRIVVRQAITTVATHPKRNLLTCLREDMFVLPSATVMSREAFEKVGGFDENLSGYEDDDLFLRMFRAGFYNLYIEDATVLWRIHRSSSSYSPRMRKSRSIFARKLIEEYPDDPISTRYFARDLIAPRFYGTMIAELKKALHASDAESISQCRDDVTFIRKHISRESARRLDPKETIISVVIPLYNGARYIEQALQSVFNQTHMPDEVIVVNDGSTDNGPEIVERLAKDYAITLLHKENGGQSSARNLGVGRSSGDLIAFLDQDDCWYPNHLEELLKPFLDSSVPTIGWVYSELDEIDEKGEGITNSFLSTLGTPHPKRDLIHCLQSDMFILPSASLIRREAFLAVGGFDEQLSGYEDDDLFLRLFRKGYRSAYIEHPLSQWRIYPTSSSYSPRMGRSRSVFARKLIAQYPDDPARARYYVRYLLAPRFFPHMLVEYRNALATGRSDLINATKDDLKFLLPHLPRRLRLALAVLLGPEPLGRVGFRLLQYLRPFYRGFMR